MSKQGFTLVELTVVLAIICALAELVFAVGAPAREAARQRTCVSNLHQIGLAFAQYRADYDGIDPTPGVPILHSALGLPPTARFHSIMMPYLRSDAVLRCPSYHGRGSPPETYMMPGSVDEEAAREIDLPMIAGDRGMEFPLAYCDQHNADLDFEGRMRWEMKRIIVVRLSQQVLIRWVPSHDMNSWAY